MRNFRRDSVVAVHVDLHAIALPRPKILKAFTISSVCRNEGFPNVIRFVAIEPCVTVCAIRTWRM